MTVNFTISSNEWAEVTNSPIQVTNSSSHSIYLLVRNALPASEEEGIRLEGGASKVFPESGKVYARLAFAQNAQAKLFLQPLIDNLAGGIAISGEAEIKNDAGDPIKVSGITKVISSSFSRPNDTNIYDTGDIIANSIIATSATPLEFAVSRINNGSGIIRRARIVKSSSNLSNASFKLHLYKTLPNSQNGDNGAFITNKASDYLGCFLIECDKSFVDGAVGFAAPSQGYEINFNLLGTNSVNIYGFLEAVAPYTPISSEVFNVSLELFQD